MIWNDKSGKENSIFTVLKKEQFKNRFFPFQGQNIKTWNALWWFKWKIKPKMPNNVKNNITLSNTTKNFTIVSVNRKICYLVFTWVFYFKQINNTDNFHSALMNLNHLLYCIVTVVKYKQAGPKKNICIIRMLRRQSLPLKHTSWVHWING